jgi:uncharacterized protein YktA (UPF0223 family)
MSIPDTIKLLKFEEINIIGSYSDVNLKYFSDVDSQEFLSTSKSYQEILESFQDKIKKILALPNLFIIDFKLGFLDGLPLKWSVKEILLGKKYVDGRIIKFVDALSQESIIKLDVILLIKDKLVEISTNYYFDFDDRGQTYPNFDIDRTKQNILFEYSKLKAVNFYKALKRLYSYYKLVFNTSDRTGVEMVKVVRTLDALRKIFNSKLGLLNKQLSGMKTLHDLIKSTMDNRKKPSKMMVRNIYKKIVDNLVKAGGYPRETVTSEIPRSMTRYEILTFIEGEIERLSTRLDDDVRNFFRDSIVRKEIALL